MALELEAYSGQTNTLFTDTNFGKAEHMIFASLNANGRYLEVEEHTILILGGSFS